MDRSADWIRAAAPPTTHPRLLDLGCGPGLYAERFARAGYAVTGVDLSPRSLDYARRTAGEQGLAIDYRRQNYLELDLDGAFDVAVMIYCDFGALSTDERRVVLQRVRDRLRPGGALVLDVFSRRKLEAFEERTVWEDHPAGGFWNAGPHFEVQRCCRFADAVSLEQIAVIAEGATSYHLWNTYFTPEMLSEELEEAGFAVAELVGDAAGAPLDETSPTIAVVARKPATGADGR
nr:class I SAM-dependent methyltransferase [Gordonibacter massiliensis (ex Traore et al. 2017)]